MCLIMEIGEISAKNDIFSQNSDSSSSTQNPKEKESNLETQTNKISTKLNPKAKEFIPSSLSNYNTLTKNNSFYNQGRQRRAQKSEIIRRTVYISNIDQQITEEQLANFFINIEKVIDCRICTNPNENSNINFSFVEFSDEKSAKIALELSGKMLGNYPIRIVPSRTGIVAINPTLLPMSENEYEKCTRTVYCTNIEKNVDKEKFRLLFEYCCGEIERLRIVEEYNPWTCIAFVQFTQAESAISALNLSGQVFGSLPIRVSPSKTPLRP